MKKLFGFSTLVLIGVLLGGILWITRMRALDIVHPARGAITRSPESVGIDHYEPVEFESPDGLTLRGWWAPSQNGAAIVFVHGHGGNRQGQLDEAAVLVREGYGALLFDLRNSGESDGAVTTFGLLEARDVKAAVEFVQAQPGVDPDRIGLLGQSMGGATVIMAAAELPEVKAVAALCAYTSMEDNIETGVEQLAGLPAFPFAPLIVFWGEWEAGMDMQSVRPVDVIAAISPRPLLIVHGELDNLIPVENGHALFAAAREPKELYLIPNAGHGGFLAKGGEAYAQKLREFFGASLSGE